MSRTDRRARRATTGRRLSPVRIGIAVVVLAALALGATRISLDRFEQDRRRSSQWFAPYVDVTLPPYANFQDPTANPNRDVVLAFVVADGDDPCTPSWGAAYDLDEAAAELDLDRRIVRHRQRGGDVVVSFGGVANRELAVACTDADALRSAYRAVVDRYRLRVIDLDLEGDGLDAAASRRRATAVAAVQEQERETGRPLDVWVTLPVAPTGLLPDSVAAVDALLAGGVDLAGVNVMAMEFGASRPADQDFVSASLAALDATAAQVRAAYRRAGAPLTVEESFAKLGLTPMIGQNEFPADRLDTDGARELADAAGRRGVTRFSMWSLNRDAPCPGNVDPVIANNVCSGVDQEAGEFSRIFGAVDGRAAPGAGVDGSATRSIRLAGVAPAGTGPHDEWRPRREYDTGAKVVWRGQVYQAAWWNVGAQPDAPVEHEWDAPWRVLGPVLADDVAPSTAPTVPAGTYPGWAVRTAYQPGERVQHRGIAYRAKWWTRGDDPAADVDNDWENAWEPLDPATATDPPADGG